MPLAGQFPRILQGSNGETAIDLMTEISTVDAPRQCWT